MKRRHGMIYAGKVLSLRIAKRIGIILFPSFLVQLNPPFLDMPLVHFIYLY
jgi:hypothetical protein